MLSLFLFLAAAVPVLGDAQINRQTDAAVKRYRDRQGNRNKIIAEESVPSCPKSSGTFERSQLDMELSKSTELFGHPGGQYRSGCCQHLVAYNAFIDVLGFWTNSSKIDKFLILGYRF